MIFSTQKTTEQALSGSPNHGEEPSLNCVFLTGKGRSGTTWLGQILNTDEHCNYKYEPFLPSKSTPYSHWRQELQDGQPEPLHQRFESIVRQCFHEVDMPPFSPKSFRTQNPQILHLLYGLGSRAGFLKGLYQWYGRPGLNANTPVLIKDVNFPNELLPHLCEAIHPYLIAMIRNPFANIASYQKGVELGLFQQRQAKDIENLKHSLEIGGNESLWQYRDCLEQMSDTQRATIRWRLQVEGLVDFAQAYTPGLVVVYEDLCNDPRTKAREIFEFLGWEWGTSTQDFIAASVSGQPQTTGKSSKDYFGVYRDPKESMSKWKTQLTPEQTADIVSIFNDSPLKGLWSDLPT
ncbi:MAG: sulfotransferase [Oscillatoriales cyanobacterium RM2_1_1]|nr:sulfotransferase [Oscillatoriales cyanobacterium SM2_3_0]NJO46419.1 sulfotransferase [Oscillatoriales cyanobacterium RM2_1_1]